MGDVLKSLLAGLAIGAAVAFLFTKEREIMDIGSTIHCAECGNKMIWSHGVTVRYYMPTARGLSGWQTLRICKRCMSDHRMDEDVDFVAPKRATERTDDSIIRRLLGETEED